MFIMPIEAIYAVISVTNRPRQLDGVREVFGYRVAPNLKIMTAYYIIMLSSILS